MLAQQVIVPQRCLNPVSLVVRHEDEQAGQIGLLGRLYGLALGDLLAVIVLSFVVSSAEELLNVEPKPRGGTQRCLRAR